MTFPGKNLAYDLLLPVFVISIFVIPFFTYNLQLSFYASGNKK